jgi:hypothetical protein
MKYFYDIEILPEHWQIAWIDDNNKRGFADTRETLNDFKKIYLNPANELIGFNNHAYDDVIITKMFSGELDPAKLRGISDAIIKSDDFTERNNRLKQLNADGYPARPDTIDVMKFISKMSLKQAQVRLGIEPMFESWDDDAKHENLREYNFHDVEATKLAYENVKVDIDGWSELLEQHQSAGFNWNYRYRTGDAKIMVALFGKPKNGMLFDLPNGDAFTLANGLTASAERGGLHSNQVFYSGPATFYDFPSLYPWILSEMNVFNDMYRETMETRVANKKDNPVLAQGQKLVLNKVSGLLYQEGSFNPMFNAQAYENMTTNARAMTFTMAKLAEEEGFDIIAINTDGIVVKREQPDEFAKKVFDLLGLEPEKTYWKLYVQRGANEYVASDGEKIKGKGAPFGALKKPSLARGQSSTRGSKYVATKVAESLLGLSIDYQPKAEDYTESIQTTYGNGIWQDNGRWFGRDYLFYFSKTGAEVAIYKGVEGGRDEETARKVASPLDGLKRPFSEITAEDVDVEKYNKLIDYYVDKYKKPVEQEVLF